MIDVCYIATIGQFEGAYDTACNNNIKILYILIRDKNKKRSLLTAVLSLTKILQNTQINPHIIIIDNFKFLSIIISNHRNIRLLIPRGTFSKYGNFCSLFCKELHIIPDGAVPTDQRDEKLISLSNKIIFSEIILYYSNEKLTNNKQFKNPLTNEVFIFPVVQKILKNYFSNLPYSNNTLLIFGKTTESILVREKLINLILNIISKHKECENIVYLPHPRESYEILIPGVIYQRLNNYSELTCKPKIILSCGSSLISLFSNCECSYKIFVQSKINSIELGRMKRSNIIADEYIEIN